jgi:hypothetical protein
MTYTPEELEAYRQDVIDDRVDNGHMAIIFLDALDNIAVLQQKLHNMEHSSALSREVLSMSQGCVERLHETVKKLQAEKVDQEKFLLHLVDVVWGDAMEDGQVPSTSHACNLIQRAKETINDDR